MHKFYILVFYSIFKSQKIYRYIDFHCRCRRILKKIISLYNWNDKSFSFVFEIWSFVVGTIFCSCIQKICFSAGNGNVFKEPVFICKVRKIYRLVKSNFDWCILRVSCIIIQRGNLCNLWNKQTYRLYHYIITFFLQLNLYLVVTGLFFFFCRQVCKLNILWTAYCRIWFTYGLHTHINIIFWLYGKLNVDCVAYFAVFFATGKKWARNIWIIEYDCTRRSIIVGNSI